MTDSLTILTVGLAATVTLLVFFGLLLWRRRERPDAAELERRRRLHVNRAGRIVEGRIIELRHEGAGEDGDGELLVYNYTVRGVEYQAAQDIGFLPQQVDLHRLAAGQPANVKYDPQNPTNSIVLCEEWSGI
ncbi:MAG: DUF3592 domain-containing protein [Terriglobia bacterium]